MSWPGWKTFIELQRKLNNDLWRKTRTRIKALLATNVTQQQSDPKHRAKDNSEYSNMSDGKLNNALMCSVLSYWCTCNKHMCGNESLFFQVQPTPVMCMCDLSSFHTGGTQGQLKLLEQNMHRGGMRTGRGCAVSHQEDTSERRSWATTRHQDSGRKHRFSWYTLMRLNL